MWRRLTALVLVVLAYGLFVGPAAAESSRRSSGTLRRARTKSVHVRSYTRKDGTLVSAHTRSAPGFGAATRPRTPRTRTTTATAGTPRTTSGRIARSEAAKHQFEAQTGYPHGRPGYVVDHIVPLACGGADALSNMQWQTIAEGKAKDKTERIGCR